MFDSNKGSKAIWLYLFVLQTTSVCAWVQPHRRISSSPIGNYENTNVLKEWFPRRSRVTLASSRGDLGGGNSGTNKKGDGDEDRKRRMAVVRSLQMSYYLSAERQAQQTDGSHYHPELDSATGILKNVPLWRVGWTELPGRSNVLNVHEPTYTNMFEKILYGPKPWLVGHLYLPGGSKNLNKDLEKEQEPYRLKTWTEEVESREASPSSDDPSQRSAVVGCLLKITDYRRMADGRLLLLVHGIHRFVVTNVQQELPYSIADVQLLPDVEEIDPDSGWVTSQTEDDVTSARAMAIEESVRFQDFEFDPEHEMPVPNKNDLEITDIPGSSITRVLPFCPYSKTLGPPAPTTEGSRSTRVLAETKQENGVDTHDDALPTTSSSRPSYYEKSTKYAKADGISNPSTLEYQLIEKRILNEPPTHPEILTPRANLTLKELEYELWLAINDYLITSRAPVSPVILGLLPPATRFPSHFVVKSIAAHLGTVDKADHDFVAVPSTYPDIRRQQRLSYSAAQLLEQTEWGKDLRQRLLEIPSTKSRLRLVLERYDMLHSDKWGEFQ